MAALSNLELKHLLQKEAQGALTPDEQQQLDAWYNSFDQSNQDLKAFRDTSHEVEVKQRLLSRILENGFPQNDVPVKKLKYKQRIQRWYAVAAILLMAVGSFCIWKYGIAVDKANAVLMTLQTGQGQIMKIRLEDGSSICLNAGSRLRYPTHFDQHHREVFLEGEAYFDVQHDNQRPFVVHTDKLTTSVLGTAFSVTAYKNIPLQSVTVIRGKVAVAHGRQLLGYLTPNKRIEYRSQNGSHSLSEVSAAAIMSWKDGKLQFENQDMQDIGGRLGRWYGYTFIFENATIKNCRYTASFNNQIPLSNLLKVMKAISLVQYKIDKTNKTVTFLGTGCNR